MTEKGFRSKLLYFAWLLLFCAITLITGFYVYLNTSQISIMDNLQVEVQGSEGNASVISIRNLDLESDPARQKFLDQIQYSAYPHTGLSNGQIITIHAQPDPSLIRMYRLNPTSLSVDVLVEGLTEQEQTLELIPCLESCQ